MISFRDVLEYGKQRNASPEEKALAVERYRAEQESKVADPAIDPEDRFKFLSRIDDQAALAMEELRVEATDREIKKQFPDEIDRQTFVTRLSHGQMEQGAGFKVPAEYELQVAAVDRAARPFQRPPKVFGAIEFNGTQLGFYAGRPLRDSNDFEVLVKKAKMATGVVVKVNSSRQQMEAAAIEKLKLTEEARSQELAKVAETEKSVTRAPDDPGFSGDFMRQQINEAADMEVAKGNAAMAIAQKGSINQVVQFNLLNELKRNDQFKDQIPNNWFSQFTARPAVSVLKGFAQAGAAIPALMGSEGAKEVLSEGDATVEKLTPGALRNRFEADGTPIADLLSQGVESGLTFLTPGVLAKLGSKALSGSGLAGNLLATSRGLSVAAVTGKAGYSSFGVTSFGNSFANRMRLADQEPDPVKAEQIRTWAPWLAIGDAITEVVSERILPVDERLLLRGGKGGFLRRLGTAGLMPLNESAEEAVGSVLRTVLLGAGAAPGSPKEDLLENVKGGFFGGLAFSPRAFFGREVKADVRPDTGEKVWHFNGRTFSEQQAADRAKAEALNNIEEVLTPAGIVTQEEALAFLERHEENLRLRQEDPDISPVTDAEMEMASLVTDLGPLLPKGSAPSPVVQAEEGGADTGGVATPEGGQSPAGGLAQNLSPVPEVKGETLGDKVTVPEAVATAPAPVTAPEISLTSVEIPAAAAARAADIEAFAPGIKYFAPDNSTPAGQILNQFSRATGTKVVLFESKPAEGRATDGFVISGDPGTIYLSRNTRQPFLHVLGHEFYHSRETMPEYQRFVEELKRLEPAAWERTGRSESEFVADVVGSRFTQKEFWDQLRTAMEPGLFRRFVEFVRQIWNDIKSKIGPRFVEVENAVAIDNMLAGLLPLSPARGPLGAPVQGVQQSGVQNVLPREVFYIGGTEVIRNPTGEDYRGLAFEERKEFPNDTSGDPTTRFTKDNRGNRWIWRSSKGMHSQIEPEISRREGIFVGQNEHIQQSNLPQINVVPRGTQAGFGVVADLDLYNINLPGSKADGTTFAVPKGADQATVQQRAREKLTEAGEALPGEVQQSSVSVEKELEAAREEMALAAQKVYDEWDQDENGESEELGEGGICDLVSSELGSVLAERGFDIVDGGQEGDDHAYIFATKNGETFMVDIHPSVYETGGGYRWVKRKEVVFNSDHVDIIKVSYEDVYGEPYNPSADPPEIKLSQVDPGDFTYPPYNPTLTPEEQEAIDEGATGTKNAAVNYLRVRYGIEGAKVVTRENRADVLQAALALIRDQPRYQDNLINRLHARPAVVEPVDACVLMLAALDSQRESEVSATELSMAVERDDFIAQGQAMARLGEANARLRLLLDINDATGTLAGRALAFRRHMLQRDYTFVRMEKAFQAAANQGGKLTDIQRQYVEMMQKKLKDAEAKIAELENRSLDAEVETYMINFFGQLEATREKFKPGLTEREFKSRLKVSATESRNRLKNRFRSAVRQSTVEEFEGIKLSVAPELSPEDRAALVVVGVEYIEDGISTVEEFKDRLVQEFGAEAAPFVESTFAAAKEMRASLRDKHLARKGKPKPSTKGAADARKDAATATAAVSDTTDGLPDRDLVKAIVRANVEAGLRGPRDVFAASLADLESIFPTLTEDDLKRIFSNYGKAIFPSKEEIARELSELNSIARLEVTIADLEKGLPAKRTGPQRNEATEQIRRLQKEVNELKRKNGFTQQTESQLKGALDAAKTRLRHEIEDLTTYIEQGGRTPEQKAGKTPAQGDAELDALRKERDELREQLKELEGPQVPTAEEQIAAVIKALQRTEETLTKRLEAGPFAADPAITSITSEEIEERRSYVATLRQMIQEQKDSMRPMKVPALQQLDRLQKQLSHILGIMDGTVAPKVPVPEKLLSAAAEEVQSLITAARDALAAEKAEASRPAKQLAAAQKALDRLIAIREGTVTPKAAVPAQALSEAEEDLRSQIATLRVVMAEEKQEATAPARALAAAQKEVDRLTEIMEGTRTPEVPVPREALSQAEEDLRLQAAAMRRVLSEEAAEARRPDRQLKAARAALERLEALLTAGTLAPAARTATEPASEAEKEIREQILTAREELAKLRAADPALNLERDKKTIATRIETLKAKLKAGDFTRKKSKVAKTTDKVLDKLRAEYVLLQKEWNRKLFLESLKSRKPGEKIRDFIGETLKLARILELGSDFGIILRQGGRTLGRPDLFAKAIHAGAKSLSEVGQQVQWAALAADPKFQLALQMGVEITDPDDIIAYKREEAFQSRWLMKKWEVKPGDSKELKAAKAAVNAPLGTTRSLARGQIIAIDTIRFGMWKAMCNTLSRFGVPTEGEMRSYARMANASTGRGSIDGEWERGVGTLFLAYRWAKSGLEYITLRPLWQPVLSGDFTLRSTAVIAAEYARNLSGIALFLLAWVAAHWQDDDDKWKIEWDPRSPRFAKLPFGNTLVDPTAGLSQWVVLLSKMITGQKKAQSGKIMELAESETGDKPAFGQGRLSELGTFLRYKLNPVLGAGLSVASGKDAVGEKTSLGRESLRLVTPLMFKDVYQAVKANGFPDGYALSIMAFFGMSIQTWEEKHRENLKEKDRVWLYRNAMTIPRVDDSATVGDVLEQESKEQKRKGTNRLLTDDEKKALLTESLPAVEQVVEQIRTRVTALPEDLTPERREKKLAEAQADLESKVKRIRRRVWQSRRK